MILSEKGLDLDFKETKKSLNIPVDRDKKVISTNRRLKRDPMFNQIEKSLKKIDFQQFITRFKWNNLPYGLDSELVEKVLYYHGSAMFFYFQEMKSFYFLPYAMSGDKLSTGIDFYGRFKKIMPYSFNGSTSTKEQASSNQKKSSLDILLSKQIKNNIIDIPMVDNKEDAEEIYNNGAVICWNSTPGLSYFVESRKDVGEYYIEYMIRILIQTQTALINSSGFNFISSKNQSYNDILQAQLDAINEDRLDGGQLIAVISDMLGDITNIQSNAPSAIADFWASFQSADNLRLKALGIGNDGVMQKSQYQNIQEQSMDINDSMQVYLNEFMERIKWASICNSIWGLQMYPEPILLPTMNNQQNSEQASGEDDSQAQGGTNEA